MKLPLYQVDAFTGKVFSGNPAAVVPLETWLPDSVMQSIASENNLSETAFFVPDGDNYHIRWFTPNQEVSLCGHATLASAYVIFRHIGHSQNTITFKSQSGPLIVTENENGYTLDFPIWPHEKIAIDDRVQKALNTDILELYKGHLWVAVLKDEKTVRDLQPDFSLIKKITEAEGLIVTAKGDDVDFVSRFFMPLYAIDEDPVTGSAHCMLCPIWKENMGKTDFKARQVSSRGGDLICSLKGDRVLITGKACLFMKGEMTLPA